MTCVLLYCFFFFSSRRRHTRCLSDWSSDVCSSDLVLDGKGQIAAGGGMDGVEGLHPAKPGDAYYFRPNCTVGFYNQNTRSEERRVGKECRSRWAPGS